MHCQQIVNKAYRILGFIIRNTKDFSIECVFRLYNALVTPQLKYISVIWTPKAEVVCDMIEKVQKSLLRYLYLKKNNTYPYMIAYASMLQNFNIERLSSRRQTMSVIFVFNVL